MITIASLQKRAADVRRALFASLPLGVRRVYAFSVLADTDLAAIGRTLGLIFIRKKVQGLPDIPSGPHAGPALDFPIDKLQKPERFLPITYLSGFAQSLGEMMRHKYGPDLAERAIDDWLFYFVVKNSWHNMREGEPLSVVRNYVLRAMEEHARRLRKRQDIKWWSGTKSIDDVPEGDEGRGPSHEIADPAAEDAILHGIPAYQRSKIRHKLEHIHPDAPLYLDLLMAGYKDKEIVLGLNADERLPDGTVVPAGKSLLPHLREKPMGYFNWQKTYRSKIRDLLAEELEDYGAGEMAAP